MAAVKARPRRLADLSIVPAHHQLSTLDPEDLGVVPVSAHEGLAFPITDCIRMDTNSTTGYQRLFAITNTGNSSTLASYAVFTPSAVASTTTFDVPMLMTADTAGGATSGRSMKVSAKLVNTVSALTMAGRVYVLNCNQRVALAAAPSAMTAAQWTTFADTIAAHPDTLALSAAEFRTPQKFVGTVVDGPEYHSYHEWHGATGLDVHAAHWAVWSGSTSAPRPMSTIFILIADPPATQGYNLTLYGSWFTRWPLDTVMGRSMTDVPTVPQTTVNQIQKKAERHARGRHIIQIDNPRPSR